jgi:osomolarity two-component system response regulator SSK1
VQPVNFVWLERKVTEWGCMQALIDYEGWRNWKEFPPPKPGAGTAKPTIGASRLASSVSVSSDAATTTGGGSREGGQSASETSKTPGVSVQAPTPPAPMPAKLAVGNGTGDAAVEDASPTSQSAPGSKTTSPTSAGAAKRGKRSSLSRGISGLTGVAEEGESEDGKAIEV